MLNDKGFTRPTYNELVEQLIDKWHQLFGEQANTATNSVGGIFIRLIAFFLNKVYELSETVYQSQFIDSAEGPTLDQLAANLGLVRRSPQAAMGSIKFYGVAGYIVPAGVMFQTKDGLIYMNSEPVTLVDTGQKQIDLTEQGFGVLSYNDQNLGVGESKLLYANGNGVKYNKPGTYDKYPADQVTPVEEVLLVQVGEINGGADLETDDQLRTRLEQASQEAPSSPYNGLISALYEVNGVNAIKIVANDSLEVDASGNPPKTLHFYVDGGYKDDIGKAIFGSIAAGVQSYGEIEVRVKDIGGTEHSVYYDEPTPLSIYAHVKVETNDDYPTNGPALIQSAVADYIKSVGMGEVVHYSYLYRTIYDSIPGIVVADVTIGTDKAALSPQDIKLNDIQRAAITLDSVVVE